MPLVSQTFDQLLDFTRTTSGTFVGSNGLIQTTPASVNLFTWTQQFDNVVWGKANTTVTANTAVAPDGTSTADKLVETVASGAHSVGQAVAVLNATVYVASAYVKAAERTFVALYAGTPGQGTIFNLSNGTVHGPLVAPPTSSSITAAGNGWYRVTITYTSISTSTAPSLFLCDGTAQFSYTGDGTSGAYVWGAQLEQAATATTYTRNNGGVYPPRFDYDPVTLAPKGILIEEQRTNLTTYSEQFDNAAWTKSGSTVSANATASPDGAATADKLVEDTSTGDHRIFNNAAITVSASATYTWSVYAKAAERTSVRVANNSVIGATFNLTNGTFSDVSGGITAASTSVGNGWYRLTITGVAATSSERIAVYLVSGGTTSYAGNGTSGAFIWGAQLEAGAFATSYIPTVASQVTRAADQTSIVAPNFAPWYNQSEGSFVVEYLATADPAGTYRSLLQANNAGSTNYNSIRNANLAPTTAITNNQVVVGTLQANLVSTTLTANTIVKTSLAYRTNDFAAVTNGAAPITDTSGSVPSDLINLTFIGGPFNAGQTWFRSIRYYPVRLSDAQLQALTA
jgi:hypothetical protein